MSRSDPTKCAKGLHDWTEENIYTNPTTGSRGCRLCKLEATRKPPEERHHKGSGHCRRGHPYTVENTIKMARIKNGVKEIVRTCRQCKKDSTKTGFKR